VSDKDLLELAVEAHGGLSCCSEVTSRKIDVSITGGIWYVKGQPDVLKDIVMVIDTRQERVSNSFVGQDRHTVFEPVEVTVRGPAGTIDEVRKNPEGSFTGQTAETPWDDVQVAYFNEALWTCINSPFLFTQDWFTSEEIGSVEVESETWRRLKVIFPEEVKTHTREQIFCCDPDGLLRRHDSTVDILGGATGLNFASDYREIDGIMFPTKRRVFAYEGDFQVVREPLLVGVDISRITKCLDSRPQHVDSPAGLA
jgi:hypothetical protein